MLGSLSNQIEYRPSLEVRNNAEPLTTNIVSIVYSGTSNISKPLWKDEIEL